MESDKVELRIGKRCLLRRESRGTGGMGRRFDQDGCTLEEWEDDSIKVVVPKGKKPTVT